MIDDDILPSQPSPPNICSDFSNFVSNNVHSYLFYLDCQVCNCLLVYTVHNYTVICSVNMLMDFRFWKKNCQKYERN